MLKYKINVGDALERIGLSQDTLKKVKADDTNISLKSLNNICMLLDMQPKDLLIYEQTEEEKEKLQKL